jgi:hypothetical protein
MSAARSPASKIIPTYATSPCAASSTTLNPASSLKSPSNATALRNNPSHLFTIAVALCYCSCALPLKFASAFEVRSAFEVGWPILAVFARVGGSLARFRFRDQNPRHTPHQAVAYLPHLFRQSLKFQVKHFHLKQNLKRAPLHCSPPPLKR